MLPKNEVVVGITKLDFPLQEFATVIVCDGLKQVFGASRTGSTTQTGSD